MKDLLIANALALEVNILALSIQAAEAKFDEKKVARAKDGKFASKESQDEIINKTFRKAQVPDTVNREHLAGQIDKLAQVRSKSRNAIDELSKAAELNDDIQNSDASPNHKKMMVEGSKHAIAKLTKSLKKSLRALENKEESLKRSIAFELTAAAVTSVIATTAKVAGLIAMVTARAMIVPYEIAYYEGVAVHEAIPKVIDTSVATGNALKKTAGAIMDAGAATRKALEKLDAAIGKKPVEAMQQQNLKWEKDKAKWNQADSERVTKKLASEIAEKVANSRRILLDAPLLGESAVAAAKGLKLPDDSKLPQFVEAVKKTLKELKPQDDFVFYLLNQPDMRDVIFSNLEALLAL